jgi:hypothetical protein
VVPGYAELLLLIDRTLTASTGVGETAGRSPAVGYERTVAPPPSVTASDHAGSDGPAWSRTHIDMNR